MRTIKFFPIFVVILFTCSSVIAELEQLISLPGSDKSYTEKQVNDFFNVPDWYPDSHSPMPEVVQYGAKPRVFACASCHLTSGSGHPESSALSGLPVDYFVRQMKAYQRFQRNSVVGTMTGIAKGMSDEQILESAKYFQSLKPLDVQEVREADEVPVTYVNSRFMRLIDSSANVMEPIGERIITLPADEYRVKARDPFAPFITYVPRGYLAQGKNIVEEGKGNAAPCTSCHGNDLKGSEIGPPIAGQHASYLLAQLRDYKAGVRRGLADPQGIMANNLKYFSEQELLATAAYIASLTRE